MPNLVALSAWAFDSPIAQLNQTAAVPLPAPLAVGCSSTVSLVVSPMLASATTAVVPAKARKPFNNGPSGSMLRKRAQYFQATQASTATTTAPRRNPTRVCHGKLLEFEGDGVEFAGEVGAVYGTYGDVGVAVVQFTAASSVTVQLYCLASCSWPAGHGLHIPPVPAEPAGQGPHTVPLALATCPSLHITQAAKPCSGAAWFGGQARQPPLPPGRRTTGASADAM